MTAKPAHQPSGSLRIAALLAAVAGFVDAHIYLQVTNIFVANMSGNMIHMGIFTGSFAWEGAEGSAAAVLAFLVGVMAATGYHDRRLRLGLPVRPHILVSVEAGLIAFLTVVLVAGAVEFTPYPEPFDYFLVALGALAMGIQTAALRRVRSVPVATTYGTGTIVRIGEKAVFGLSGGVRPLLRNGDLSSIPMVILATVLVCYVGGAALAAFLGANHLMLILPVLALVAAAVALRPVLPASPLPQNQPGR